MVFPRDGSNFMQQKSESECSTGDNTSSGGDRRENSPSGSHKVFSLSLKIEDLKKNGEALFAENQNLNWNIKFILRYH